MNIEDIERIKKIINFCKNNKECKKSKMCNDCYIEFEDVQAIETLLTAYEEEKEKNKKIDEFCRKELAFERRLKRENREPDEFNQGRFYVSENIRKIISEEE